MKTTEETRIIPLIPPVEAAGDEQQQKLADETWRKSIPAQVFLNYFFAINYHIQENDDVLGGLQNLPFFRSHTAELNDADVATLTKLLHTGARSTRCGPRPSWATTISCATPCTGRSRRPTTPSSRACRPSYTPRGCARTTVS
ncbi:hypothetical protein ACFQT0_23360 [Hymenobacter humi]|uniref:Uncharacterized protein n=1 Tax=Hymenobacter humi TaxID=1411620 RepID=A0ABW2UCB0_9BACT